VHSSIGLRLPEGEVTSDYGDRYEGIRVKHVSQGNSVKAYDKAGSILRIETTINNVTPFRSYRTVCGYKDMPRELSFEFLAGLLDSRLDLIQFMDIKRRGKSNLKRSGGEIMISPTFHLTIRGDRGILIFGEHGSPP